MIKHQRDLVKVLSGLRAVNGIEAQVPWLASFRVSKAETWPYKTEGLDNLSGINCGFPIWLRLIRLQEKMQVGWGQSWAHFKAHEPA